MERLIIRTATSEDLEAVYRLICELEETTFEMEAFASIFEYNINHPDYRYFLAETGGSVAGMISLHSQRLLHHCGVVGEIQEMIVKEEFRGQKIGEALLHKAMTFSKEKNWLQVEVSSNKKREGAHRFYLKNGFAHNHFKFVSVL